MGEVLLEWIPSSEGAAGPSSRAPLERTELISSELVRWGLTHWRWLQQHPSRGDRLRKKTQAGNNRRMLWAGLCAPWREREKEEGSVCRGLAPTASPVPVRIAARLQLIKQPSYIFCAFAHFGKVICPAALQSQGSGTCGFSRKGCLLPSQVWDNQLRL